MMFTQRSLSATQQPLPAGVPQQVSFGKHTLVSYVNIGDAYLMRLKLEDLVDDIGAAMHERHVQNIYNLKLYTRFQDNQQRLVLTLTGVC